MRLQFNCSGLYAVLHSITGSERSTRAAPRTQSREVIRECERTILPPAVPAFANDRTVDHVAYHHRSHPHGMPKTMPNDEFVVHVPLRVIIRPNVTLQRCDAHQRPPWTARHARRVDAGDECQRRHDPIDEVRVRFDAGIHVIA
jgi:hypothetical protein